MGAVTKINATVSRVVNVPFGAVVNLLNNSPGSAGQRWEILSYPRDINQVNPDFTTNFSAWAVQSDGSLLINQVGAGPYAAVQFTPDVSGDYYIRLTDLSTPNVQQTALARVAESYTGAFTPAKGENMENTTDGWSREIQDHLKFLSMAALRGKIYRIYNPSGTPIPRGTIVKVTGSIDVHSILGNAVPAGSTVKRELVAQVSVADIGDSGITNWPLLITDSVVPASGVGWGQGDGIWDAKTDVNLSAWTYPGTIALYLGSAGQMQVSATSVLLGLVLAATATNGSIYCKMLGGGGASGGTAPSTGSGQYRIPFGDALGELVDSPQLMFNAEVLSLVATSTDPTPEWEARQTTATIIPNGTIMGRLAFRCPSPDGQALDHNTLYAAVEAVLLTRDISAGPQMQLKLGVNYGSLYYLLYDANNDSGHLAFYPENSGVSLGTPSHLWATINGYQVNANFLTVGSAAFTSASVGGHSLYVPTQDDFSLQDDFLTGPPFAVFATNTVGAGATVTCFTAVTPPQVGVGICNVGTTSTGRAQIYLPPSGTVSLSLGAGWKCFSDVMLPSLSNGSDSYWARVGFQTGEFGTGQICVFAEYSHNINSGKWTLYLCNGSTLQVVSSQMTVQANTWYRVGIVQSLNGSLNTFTMTVKSGGLSYGAVASTTNPLGSLQFSALDVIKFAGTTPVSGFVDQSRLWSENYGSRI